MEQRTQVIDKEFQLGVKILSLNTKTGKMVVKAPKKIQQVLEKDADGNPTKWEERDVVDENGNPVYEYKEVQSIYPEAFNMDSILANLTPPELRAIRLGYELFFHVVSYGYRYNRDLTDCARQALNFVKHLEITSRGRRMEAGKLAKTNYQFSESKYNESMEGPKKPGLLDMLKGE